MSAPASTPPAAAPATPSTPPTAAPATAAATETAAATTPAAVQRSRKRRFADSLLGSRRVDDLEKQLKSDDEDAKRRRRVCGLSFGMSLLGLMLTMLFSTLFTLGLAAAWAYVLPMLTCKMHGYSSQCMFNGWDKNGVSLAEFLSEKLPDGFFGGFHDQDW